MTDPNPAPLPRRIAWFAPWTWFRHWTPWKRWSLGIGCTLAGYILSPVPVFWIAQRIGGPNAHLVLLFTLYLPLLACRMLGLGWFYAMQDRWLRSVIGDP